MTVTKLDPPTLGAPLGLYSHVSHAPAGRLVFVAGQVGADRSGELAGTDDVEAQTEQAFANVGRALAAAGAGWEDVVKSTTYLISEDLIDGFMAARRRVFAELFPGGGYPPNTLLVVRRLVEPGLLVEIDAFAVVDLGGG
jgi:enamine deaminase RidA (YjgF/YER057c/UK114 family)